MHARAAAPEGWYYAGSCDPVLPIPDVIFPKGLLKFELALPAKRFGMCSHPEWKHDESQDAFRDLKDDIKDYKTFFTAAYNSQRIRKSQSQRTVEGAFVIDLVNICSSLL